MSQPVTSPDTPSATGTAPARRHPGRPGPAARPGPLAGLLVADFSRVLAGPYCTMLLADLGADVIKVESPGGDDTRRWMPPVTEDGVVHLLPGDQPQQAVGGARPARRRRPGRRPASSPAAPTSSCRTSSRAGWPSSASTTTSVSAVNPGIIYASISGFGAGGGKDLPGYDLMVQAMSGLMSLTGDPDGPPYRAGISVFDVIAGLHTAIGILAALHHRAATGEGQHVEASLLASALSGMVNQTSAYVAGGVVPFRMGNAHPSLFPVRAAAHRRRRPDRHRGQRRPVPQALRGARRPGARRRPAVRRATTGRTANRDQLRPLLASAWPPRTAEEWFDELIAAGVPVRAHQHGGRRASPSPREIGLEPVVTAGSGEAASAHDPAPAHLLGHPAAATTLPPPALDEHGERDPGLARRATRPAAPPRPAGPGQRAPDGTGT